MAAGSYKLKFFDNSGTSLPHWYGPAAEESTAKPLAVTAGQQLTGIDGELAKAATVSGRVAAPEGVNLSYVAVRVYEADSMSNSWYASINEDGSYTVAGLTEGRYKVQFDGYGSGALEQWHSGADSFEEATPLTLASGQDLTGIDANLLSAATISGHISAPPGVDLSRVTVQVLDAASTSHLGWASLAENGSYKVIGLAAGTYKVQFEGPDSGALEQWYSGADSFEAATPLTLTTSQHVTGIDANLVKGASIGGTVTAPEGVDLTSTLVTISQADRQTFSGTGQINADGTYVVRGLPAGSYKVQFSGYNTETLEQWYAGASTLERATTVVLRAGEDVAGIDVTLVKGASVSGKVSAPAGVNLESIEVSVSRADTMYIPARAQVNADGTYRVGGLPTGSYKVQFAGYRTGTLEQWHAGASSFEDATPVALTAGKELTGINASLRTGASISGRATTPAGVDPTAVQIELYRGDLGHMGSERLAADGSYTFTGLPAGPYKIQFYARDSGALDQWYGGALDSTTAEAIILTDGQQLTATDTTLAKAASISGKVTTPPGVAVSAVTARLSNADFPSWRGVSASVQSDGTYRFGRLREGNYKIHFSGYGSGALDSWYMNDTASGSATVLPLTAGQDLTGIDMTLVKGASISGKVTAPPGIDLTAVTAVATKGEEVNGISANVNADGTYAVKSLAAGTYRVKFSNYNSGALDEWYDNVQTQAAATPVAVSAGQDRTGVDAGLAKGATISGKITAPTSGVFSSVYVNVFNAGDKAFVASTYTDQSGNYSVRGLTAGTYKIEFQAMFSALLTQWYNKADSIDTATPVTVADGQTITSIDATMVRGATISGKITAPEGINLHSAQVFATRNGKIDTASVNSSIDADGSYALTGLEPGTYKLMFSGGQGGATDLWYGGTSPESAKPINVVAEQTVTGIDMTVPTGASVSGTVTGPGPNHYYLVSVLDAAGNTIKNGFSEADGRYSVVGLLPGSYKVAFNRSEGTSKEEAQFYPNKPESAGVGQATLITLAPGQRATNIDAVLNEGGSVTGTILDKAGKPLSNAFIKAYTRDGSLITRYATSGPDGKFGITGLSTGRYLLQAAGYMMPGEVYSGNTATEANAAPVTVVSGSATTFDLSFAAVDPDLTASTPTITGTAKVDSTLTAEPGTWGPSPVTLSYQWKADGADIAGATANTYKPTAATVGKILTVSVTGSKAGYATASRTSAETTKVAAGTLTAPTPTISGAAAVDSTLTAAPGTWEPAPVALGYQWKADGADIAGATANTYKPTTATAGKALTITVTGTKDGYITGTRTSAATAKVAAAALTAPTPSISGTAKMDSTLTAVPGAWGPGPVTLKYQWNADGVSIAGATAGTYKATAATVGKILTVSVTGSKADFLTVTRTSSATAKVAAGTLTAPTPAVKGTANVGSTLTATVGTWAPSPVALKYQWKANGVAITGATAATFKPTAAQVGKTLTFSVTGTKTGYTTATKTSAATGVVMALNPALTAPTPRISGTVKVGYTLTAVPGTWGPATVTLKYQWKANGVAIAGGTASTYKPSAAVVGKTISVTVTGSKAGYNTAAKTSALTARVAVGTLSAPVPGISGAVRVGSALTATGAWGPAPVTLKYQWKANGVAIAGATAGTYAPSTAVLGKVLTVTVTGSKSGFTTVTKTSAVSVKVAAGVLTAPVPAVSGTATVGSVLTAVPGTWGPAPVTLKYQWYANGVALTSATASTYKPLATDVGKTLTVTVTGSKAGFTTAAKTSAATAAVS
ncbi:UNVERIFIED_ORG: hypothetical protein J2X79_001885 [Arthrobacter globiformis]|nr:hypothetical protein [Arthrobacter globiformis]